MTKIDEIFESDIMSKLRLIEGVSTLDGWLVLYAKDLHQGKNGLSFPCVAAQLGDDTVTLSGNNLEAKISRTVKLLGAVDVKDPSQVNQKLNELVFNVRKALAVDKTTRNSTMASKITLGNTKYDLPDAKDSYAYFDMVIVIDYTEKWKE